MARYAKSFIVKAPQDRVYSRWLTAMNELVTLAPERFRAFRVIQDGDRERVTECIERWAGRDLKYQTLERLVRPTRAEQTVVQGHGKGSRTIWNFRAVPGGTEVHMDLRLKGFEGFMMGVIMKKRFHQEMDETLQLWTRAIERTST